MSILYVGDNPTHIRSFLVTTKIFNMVMLENYPTSCLRFPNPYRMEMIYDFLCLQAENEDIHMEILKRNVYVAALKKTKNLFESDFLLSLNIFLAIYITNCKNLSMNEEHLALETEILTYEGLINISDNLGTTMRQVVDVGFGGQYSSTMLETKLMNFKKAWAHVVDRR